jgi:hypothetical protein
LHKVIRAAALIGALAIGAGAISAARPNRHPFANPLAVPKPSRLPHVLPDPAPAHAVIRKHVVAPRKPPVRHRATNSLYIRSVSPSIMHAKGCEAGQRGTHGLVILDFGRLSSWHGHVGTILFSDRFASLDEMTQAMHSFAGGYASCVPRSSGASIVLARGTSNYYPTVPSTYWAGRHWAAATQRLERWLVRKDLDDRVTAAAAIDAEPAWDRAYTRTYGFFKGYRAQNSRTILYNYGSLDGGPGVIWSVRQAFYVAGGNEDVRVVPEIYYPVMARQWAQLARVAERRFHRTVRFAGVMTQRWPGCRGCGMTPREAHTALARELLKHPRTRAAIGDLQLVTNIS